MHGVHRIQRVPPTEKNGRRHSSTIVVSYISDFSKPKIVLDKSDVRVDTFRSTGPGGQHRNKTDSAVRLTHLPSNIVVTATEDRSQHVNRKVAWERLREAIHALNVQDMADAVNSQKVGTVDKPYTWTWTDWRDEVKHFTGRKVNMKKALSGKLGPMLK